MQNLPKTGIRTVNLNFDHIEQCAIALVKLRWCLLLAGDVEMFNIVENLVTARIRAIQTVKPEERIDAAAKLRKPEKARK